MFLPGSFIPVTNNISTPKFGDFVNDLTGVSSTNAFSAEEAQKQRDWQERMSSTEYQRTVADMIKAGLNPATLTAGSMSTNAVGAGASASGSGNSASVLSSLLSLAAKAVSKGTNVIKIYR